jgi:hypothetical protein
LRFANLEQVEERADELRAITAAWCAHNDRHDKPKSGR